MEIWCDRGANIARVPGVSEPTAVAIRCMDEHWDGGGYPEGLRKDGIPRYARIIGLAQVTEIIGEGRGTQHCPSRSTRCSPWRIGTAIS